MVLRYAFNIVQFSKNNENKDRPLISEAYFHYYHHKELHAFYLLQHSLILSQVFMFLLSSRRLLLIFALQNVKQQFIPNNYLCNPEILLYHYFYYSYCMYYSVTRGISYNISIEKIKNIKKVSCFCNY